MVVAGSIAVVAATVLALRSPLLDVDTVLVAGSTTVDRSEVARASGIRRGDAMVDVDPASARRAVMALPGVASARVERDWPGRVRISVTDEVPSLVISSGDARWVVGRGGRVLEQVAAGYEPQVEPGSDDRLIEMAADPALIGDAATTMRSGQRVPDDLVAAVTMVEQMSSSLRERVGSVELARSGAMSIELTDDAGRIVTGLPEDVPAKLLAIDSVLAGVDLTCLDVLDVREPSRPTVSRRGGCRVNPPTVGQQAPVGGTRR